MYKKYIVAILLLGSLLCIGSYMVYIYAVQNGYIMNNTPNVETKSGQGIGVSKGGTAKKVLTKDKMNTELHNITPADMQNTADQVYKAYKEASNESHNVIGWIYISGSRVDYPVMGGMNTHFWLTHNWLKTPDVDGSIFRDENLYNWGPVNVIHGHNMASQLYDRINNIKYTMFASLTWFRNADYFNDADHHLIYLCTGNAVNVYKVFAVKVVEPTFQFNYTASTPSQLEAYAQQLASTSILPAHSFTDAPLLLLNTCVVEGHERHQITCSQEIAVYTK